MGHSCEFPIEPLVMVAVDVLLEVIAGDDKVGTILEPNRVVNGDAMDQEL